MQRHSIVAAAAGLVWFALFAVCLARADQSPLFRDLGHWLLIAGSFSSLAYAANLEPDGRK